MNVVKLIRLLIYPIARWIVAANNVVPSVIALDSRAPNSGGVAPHHLSVVQALVPSDATVGVVIVVLFFRSPQIDCRYTAKTATTTLG